MNWAQMLLVYDIEQTKKIAAIHIHIWAELSWSAISWDCK